MNTIKIYVANLGKYNEGELVGNWFDLQEFTDLKEITEIIGVAANTRYEEYAIHDFEAPFHIEEYSSIQSLIEIAERMEGMEEEEIKIASELLDNGIINEFEEGLNCFEDGEVLVYHDCKDMSDVAYEIMEETGQLEELPEMLRSYFDFEAYGRDLEIEGTFIYMGNETYIQSLI